MSLADEIKESVIGILSDPARCTIAAPALFLPIEVTEEMAVNAVMSALTEHEPRITVTSVTVQRRMNAPGIDIFTKYKVSEKFMIEELEKKIEDLISLTQTQQTKIAALENKIIALETFETRAQSDLASLKQVNDAKGYALIQHTEPIGRNGSNPTPSEHDWFSVGSLRIIQRRGSLSELTIKGKAIELPPGTYRLTGRLLGCGVVRFKAGIMRGSARIAEGESVGTAENAFSAGLTLTSVSEVRVETDLTDEINEIYLIGIYAHTNQFNVGMGVAVFGDSTAQIPFSKAGSVLYEHYSSLEIVKLR